MDYSKIFSVFEDKLQNTEKIKQVLDASPLLHVLTHISNSIHPHTVLSPDEIHTYQELVRQGKNLKPQDVETALHSIGDDSISSQYQEWNAWDFENCALETEALESECALLDTLIADYDAQVDSLQNIVESLDQEKDPEETFNLDNRSYVNELNQSCDDLVLEITQMHKLLEALKENDFCTEIFEPSMKLLLHKEKTLAAATTKGEQGLLKLSVIKENNSESDAKELGDLLESYIILQDHLILEQVDAVYNSAIIKHIDHHRKSSKSKFRQDNKENTENYNENQATPQFDVVTLKTRPRSKNTITELQKTVRELAEISFATPHLQAEYSLVNEHQFIDLRRAKAKLDRILDQNTHLKTVEMDVLKNLEILQNMVEILNNLSLQLRETTSQNQLDVLRENDDWKNRANGLKNILKQVRDNFPTRMENRDDLASEYNDVDSYRLNFKDFVQRKNQIVGPFISNVEELRLLDECSNRIQSLSREFSGLLREKKEFTEKLTDPENESLRVVRSLWKDFYLKPKSLQNSTP